MAQPTKKARIEQNNVILANGQAMPLVGLGTWKSKPGQVEAAVKVALESGYRHIDCAAIYGNEPEIGRALTSAFEAGTVKRDDVFVVSKLWNTKHTPSDVLGACEKTLADLQLAYLDLYLIHWPNAFKSGDDVFPKDADGNLQYDFIDPVDTWKAMEDLVKRGLVKSIGLSNFNSEQIANIVAAAEIPPTVLQIESHPYFQQDKLIEFAQNKGLAVTAYSPLGSADRPWAGDDEPRVLDNETLKKIADKHNKSVAQICIRFQAQRGVIVIPKSVTDSRIKANFEVFDFSLDAEDMEAIRKLNRDLRYCIPTITVDGKKVARDAAHPYFPFNIPF